MVVGGERQLHWQVRFSAQVSLLRLATPRLANMAPKSRSGVRKPGARGPRDRTVENANRKAKRAAEKRHRGQQAAQRQQQLQRMAALEEDLHGKAHRRVGDEAGERGGREVGFASGCEGERRFACRSR